MVKVYYGNMENKCFASSLSNVLVEMGDREMAKEVFYEYDKHPLIESNGRCCVGIGTKLVRDLTGGKYDAVSLEVFKGLRHMIENECTITNKRELLAIMDEEILASRLLKVGCAEIQGPSVVFVEGHFVATTRDGRSVINNGRICSASDFWKKRKILSAMRVGRTIEEILLGMSIR